MRHGIFTAFAVVLMGSYAVPALALQQLCTSSPENPTLILGLLGAGAAGVPYLRHRARTWLGRKSRRDRAE